MKSCKDAGSWRCLLLLLALFCFTGFTGPRSSLAGTAWPLAFTDDAGKTVTIERPPTRVVSLVPAITEILFRIGAGDAVCGVTYHSTFPPEAATREIVGGFFAPSPERIQILQPDLVFYAPIQKKSLKGLSLPAARLICLEADSIQDSYRVIRQLGRIFNREGAASEIIAKNRAQLDLISRKVARIPPAQRMHVMRLMGRERLMTPGDDSFQNEMIRAAGGISPVLGKKGSIVPVTLAEFRRFNPQVIYACGADRTAADELLGREGWREVDAVRNHRVYYFPCDLTCRVATNTGYFVAWLSARIYRRFFRQPCNYLLKDQILSAVPLKMDLPWVAQARIVRSRIADFDHKTLLIDFKTPMMIVSTLEGCRSNISAVGNHYMPPPYWGFGRLADIKRDVLGNLGRSADHTALLVTGVDMDHLVVRRTTFRDLSVTALVTAGVHGNAMRASRDQGSFYEPGTINILLLTNARLSPRAMTRALVTATEAKTAALQDLDIRSSYQPRRFSATGTGTDNIIIVQGRGVPIDNSGGHTRMGELIAGAVHGAVLEAVFRQNGLMAARNIFQRLLERRINMYDLASRTACGGDSGDIARALEAVLLNPRHAAFVKAAFALSDAREAGRVQNLTAFRRRSLAVAREISGKRLPELQALVLDDDLPPVLGMALNGIVNGVCARTQP